MPSFKNLRRKPENSQETFFLFPKSGHLATQRAIFFKSYFTKKYAPPQSCWFSAAKMSQAQHRPRVVSMWTFLEWTLHPSAVYF